jgi:hypothetical protein
MPILYFVDMVFVMGMDRQACSEWNEHVDIARLAT